ncbi:hypothetical protein [Dyadobacter sp. CY323]|uniref:hypothetical protein n=1 Tax=Dyadobacter sp. CY323 TaxID=2907302 RepID=UPI001F3F2151|nr:hypothetical protein [Dyadobacter sp. CY323]MCE6990153.1 hypothetical protein [Dyadobacter sp. CY323]
MNLTRYLTIFVICQLLFPTVQASELYIGKATADITPAMPVALMGQFNLRIAKTADTPLTANIVALESRDGTQSVDATIIVSCDLIYISAQLLAMVRAEAGKRIKGLDVNKIILNATHTHTAPVLEDGPDEASFLYPIPKGVVPVKDYKALFTKKVADAIVQAWNSRAPGSMTWGLNRTAVGYNRRSVYADKKTIMYGKTNSPEFRNLEGYEDHDINSLFFWNKAGKLIAMSLDVACPAQELEHQETVNADYWHLVRQGLQKKFGADVCVLGWIAAAGDQSPHTMYRKSADERMLKLNKMTRLEDIAQRVINSAEASYNAVKNDKHTNVKLVHKVEKLKLPMRIITAAEYKESMAVRDEAAAIMAKDSSTVGAQYAKMTWFGDVLKRYDWQQKNPDPTYESEIHVVRIGDIVVCTNQFELFTDYGIRIQARSKALQTFVVQLAGPGTYLPTEKAIAGGGYSAVCQSNVVGAEGGQMLVDRTVALIDGMWEEKE